MRRVKIGHPSTGFVKVWFVSDYDEMTIRQLSDWMKRAGKLHDCRVQISELCTQIAGLHSTEDSSDMLDDLLRLRRQLLDRQLFALCGLCKGDFYECVTQSKCIDYAQDIPAIYDYVTQDLKDFNSWFDQIKPIASFRHWLTRYKVPDMSTLSCWRAHQFQSGWNKIDEASKSISGGDLESFLKIAAFAIRPKRQKADYGLKSMGALVSYSDVKGYSPEEKLEYFASKFSKQVERNKVVLSSKKASLVIGLCKAFFAKQNETHKTFARSSSGDLTEQSKLYQKVFGMRRTVTSLSEATGEASGELWLSSVEALYITVLERNLKADSDEAETNERMRRQDFINKHHNHNS